MSEDIKEHLKTPREATPAGPELTAIAERLIGELPDPCKDCGLAESLGCTIVAGEWWIPQTPSAARISVSKGSGRSMFSSWAEFALRNLVKSANEGDEQGPKGDGTVCCIETRDIQSAAYTD